MVSKAFAASASFRWVGGRTQTFGTTEADQDESAHTKDRHTRQHGYNGEELIATFEFRADNEHFRHLRVKREFGHERP